VSMAELRELVATVRRQQAEVKIIFDNYRDAVRKCIVLEMEIEDLQSKVKNA
jgi:hypothetical protein